MVYPSKRKFLMLGIVALACAASAVAQDDAKDPALAKAELAKAIAEADKAKVDAEAAIAKAKFGALADYEMVGTSEVGANAGKLEAALLASEATREAAEQIAQRVCQTLGKCKDANDSEPSAAVSGSAGPIIVVTEAEKITYDAYDAFNVHAGLIEQHLKSASDLKPDEGDTAKALTTGTSFTATAAAVGVVANLLRSDYELSAIELEADDLVLAKAVLSAARSKQLGRPFRLPGQYVSPLDAQSNPALARLKALDSERTKLAQKIAADKKEASELQEQAKKEKNKAKAADLQKQSAGYAPVIAAREAALKRYDEFVAKLGTGDDKGVIPLSIVVRQAAMARQIDDGGLLLVLKANLQGGSAYAKKNFWTFFGSMPFYVGGGALASFTLIEGKSGDVIDAGVFAHTAPFAKVHKTINRYDEGNPAAKKN